MICTAVMAITLIGRGQMLNLKMNARLFASNSSKYQLKAFTSILSRTKMNQWLFEPQQKNRRGKQIHKTMRTILNKSKYADRTKTCGGSKIIL